MKKTKSKKKTSKEKSLRKSLSGKSSSSKTISSKPSAKKKLSSKKPSSKKPKEKSSFKPDPEKLDLIRQTFVTILWRHEALPPLKVREIVEKEMGHQFSEEFQDYFNHVNELLMRYKLIEEVPDKKPVHIRLAQRLEE